MTTRADIVAEARGWIGTPFRHEGRSALGIDCAGLIIKVAHALGLSEFDVKGYERNAAGFDFVAAFEANMDEVLPITAMQAGDALIFVDAIYPCHCGILSMKHGQPHIIHAHATKRRAWEDPYAFDWPSKLRRAFRYRGIED